MSQSSLHILVGWVSILLGVISGAVIGLFFHNEEWAGGYGSFRRRMLRLGHIAFMGLGFINMFYGLTLTAIVFPPGHASISSIGFIVGVITMPSCCFLAAWRKPLRHLFPIPVIGVLMGIIPILLGWPDT